MGLGVLYVMADRGEVGCCERGDLAKEMFGLGDYVEREMKEKIALSGGCETCMSVWAIDIILFSKINEVLSCTTRDCTYII